MVIDHTNLYYGFTINLIGYINHTYIAYIFMQYIIKKRNSKVLSEKKTMLFS